MCWCLGKLRGWIVCKICWDTGGVRIVGAFLQAQSSMLTQTSVHCFCLSLVLNNENSPDRFNSRSANRDHPDIILTRFFTFTFFSFFSILSQFNLKASFCHPNKSSKWASSRLRLHDMFQENSTAFPSATAVMKSSRWKYLFCVGCTHLGVWVRCMLGVWGAMQGAQGCPRLPPPPPTALSTRSALPYLVCFCILCCSYFSWGIFLAALQLQEVCIFFAISYIWRVYENRIVWLW